MIIPSPCLVVLSLLCGLFFYSSQSVHPYDKSVQFFSKSGRLHQVEYALKASHQGESVLCAITDNNEAIVCIPNQGVTHKLLDRRCVDKLMKVDEHIAICSAGLGGDAMSVVKMIRNYCIGHYNTFGSSPSVLTVAKKVAEMQHQSTISAGILST
jgi:proteasome alpha subunit